MGAVWSADHLSLGHGVAIKFLSVTVASNDDARGRFTREAMLAAHSSASSRGTCVGCSTTGCSTTARPIW